MIELRCRYVTSVCPKFIASASHHLKSVKLHKRAIGKALIKGIIHETTADHNHNVGVSRRNAKIAEIEFHGDPRRFSSTFGVALGSSVL